jgi:hypothetical protein
MFNVSVTNMAYKPQVVPLVALLLVLVATPVSNALADNRDLKESIATVAGKTYGEWAAKWWQWAFDTSFAQFQSGEIEVDCSAGQKGSVWFLAGSISGEPASRTCRHKIPRGKVLFFPLINYGFWNPDASCSPDTRFNCTAAQKRENANGFFSDQIPGNLGGSLATYACQLSAFVDDVPVQTVGYPIVRTQSPVFPLNYPDGTVLQADDPETIDDGYYVAIPPLDRGKHIIKLMGGLCGFDQSPQGIADGASPAVFSVNVTYHLSVGM